MYVIDCLGTLQHVGAIDLLVVGGSLKTIGKEVDVQSLILGLVGGIFGEH